MRGSYRAAPGARGARGSSRIEDVRNWYEYGIVESGSSSLLLDPWSEDIASVVGVDGKLVRLCAGQAGAMDRMLVGCAVACWAARDWLGGWIEERSLRDARDGQCHPARAAEGEGLLGCSSDVCWGALDVAGDEQGVGRARGRRGRGTMVVEERQVSTGGCYS